MGRSSVLDLADDETDARASREMRLGLGVMIWCRRGKKKQLSC